MRRAVVKGAVAFIVSFLLLSLATAFAFEEAEHILSLFAGAALSSYSAKDAPGATETDLAVILKERPDELMANGARFLRYYGYLPGASYTNRHKPLWMNLALALFAGLLASFQSARGEKKT